MWNRRPRLIAAGCLIAGLAAGASGAQVLATQKQYRNSGLFMVRTSQTAYARVALDDVAGAPPTRVILQILDAAGVAVARKDTQLLPGQSATLTKAGPGVFRVHIDVIDPDLQLSARRATPTSVEVVDTLTTEVRSVCYDPGGHGHDRY